MPWTLSAFADESGPTTHDQIAALQRGGLSRIDPRSVDGHNITSLPLKDAEQVQAQFEKAGIAVNMFGSPIGKIDVTDEVQADLEKLEHLGKLKDIFGCHSVRMFSYYNRRADLPREEWRARTLENLNRLRELAARLDLVLYHENEGGIYGDHSDQVLELAELRDGQTFKLIYDFGNYIRTGEAGWDTWLKMKDRTDYFHFKDQNKSNQHLPMGRGDTDSEAILKDAAASGHDFGCTLEPHLTHSDAVLSTESTGTGDQSLKDRSPAETFQIAVDETRALLNRLGIEYR